MVLSRSRPKPSISEQLKGTEVEIDTPSRLHFTLIDLNGSLGRIDGGIGVALNSPRIKIRIKPAGLGEAKSENGDKNRSIPPVIEPIFKKLKNYLNIEENFQFDLVDSIPKHIGLGSNTQLALAVAKGVTYFMGLELPADQLARAVSRGGTSGIGVATFSSGGFVMDGGHRLKDKAEFLPSHYSEAAPPKLMFRSDVPANWYFVMTTPYIGQGLHGDPEAEIFKNNCPVPKIEVQSLSHLILMKLLPALAEEDIVTFGSALQRIQGLGFKRVENEIQDQVVKNLYDFYYENGALGAGLSSFGPTTYALVDGESSARHLKSDVEKYLRDQGIACDVKYSNVDNNGAKLRRR
jgi:beta-ribofuranosylaminobenzene 5'-phosphate synthase